MLSSNSDFLMTDFWVFRSIEAPTATLYSGNSLGICGIGYSLLKYKKIFGKIIISAKGDFIVEGLIFRK